MASSRILVIGGTGSIGRYIAKASVSNGHPTFVLVTESTASNPEKAQLLESFKASGITLVQGSLDDYTSLLEAIKLVDVVISTVGAAQVADQFSIINAIKEVGTIKRFLPSEFGNVVEKEIGLEPVKTVFVVDEEAATYTIKAVDDPRTLNKTLYMRPPTNILSMNELVGLWENKIGKTLDKVYVPEEQIVKSIQETGNFLLSLYHSTFVEGTQENCEMGPNGVEATELFPEVKCTTIDEYLNQFV
eukprot:PITA_03338